MFPKLMSLDETLLEMEMVENRCDRRDEVSLWLPRSGHLLGSILLALLIIKNRCKRVSVFILTHNQGLYSM